MSVTHPRHRRKSARAERAGEPPRRRLSADERREAILDAALEVFASRGAEASMGSVAREAGISKALIYEHFKSKEALRNALLTREVTILIHRLAESAAPGPQPPGERLRAGLDAFFAFVEERRDAWRMVFRATTDPETAAHLDAARSQVAALVGVLIAADPVAGLASKEPDRELAIKLIAEQLTGAVQALANWWDDHREVPRERVLESAMDFAWLGMERLREGTAGESSG